MMKKRYIKPILEVYSYQAEEGYATTVALQKDYVLIEGNDRESLRSADEVTEYTDAEGQFSAGKWDDE